MPAEEAQVAQDTENAKVKDVGYPGGPYDRSLLIYYGDHIARYVWGREVL